MTTQSAIKVLANHVGAIAIWNDTPERTQAEVLDVFDCAIAACEEES